MMESAVIPDSLLSMRVPEPLTRTLTWLSIALAVIGVLWSLNHLRRTGEPMPLFLGIGGAIASMSEPLYDIAALIWHPVIGQWTAFHLFGRDVPMFIPWGWCWNVGFSSAVLWLLFHRGRIRAENLWFWFAASVAMNMLFEIPGTSLGIYAYYGHQPLPLTAGLYPLGIAFGNGTAMLTVAFLAHRLEPLFRRGALAWSCGWFITPFGFWAGSGPGWIPTMMAAQSQGWSAWAIHAMGLASIALCLGLVAVYRRVLLADMAACSSARLM
jgi:hypothetical protein